MGALDNSSHVTEYIYCWVNATLFPMITIASAGVVFLIQMNRWVSFLYESKIISSTVFVELLQVKNLARISRTTHILLDSHTI